MVAANPTCWNEHRIVTLDHQFVDPHQITKFHAELIGRNRRFELIPTSFFKLSLSLIWLEMLIYVSFWWVGGMSEVTGNDSL